MAKKVKPVEEMVARKSHLEAAKVLPGSALSRAQDEIEDFVNRWWRRGEIAAAWCQR
jgi:hypothetical protein